MLTRDLYTFVQAKEWEERKGRVKRSFWASDCLKPSLDIYWKWMDFEETDPMMPNTMLSLQVRKMFEEKLVQNLAELGEIKPIEDGKQFRVEMEREYVPVTGYMDAVCTNGDPMEIKTHWLPHLDEQFDNGKPPSEHYCYQLAVYMDFLGKDHGILAQGNIVSGNVWFIDMYRIRDLVFECNGFQFDLGAEYKRWRKIMEENIIPRKEPDLEDFYHPEVTNELLDKYTEDKIKAAIKGRRMLCDHTWRYQYSSYKQLVIKKESELKGISEGDLCTYSDAEIDKMMDYLNVEWKEQKNGMVLRKRK